MANAFTIGIAELRLCRLLCVSIIDFLSIAFLSIDFLSITLGMRRRRRWLVLINDGTGLVVR
jgi:hypothetical protein